MIRPEATIAEIVRKHYRTSGIFKKYGISFCCGGEIDLKTACERFNLDYEKLTKELEMAIRPFMISGGTALSSWKLSFLIDYIIHIHHNYIQDFMPELSGSLLTFFEGHKKKYPEFENVLNNVHCLQQALNDEMKQEEEIIFPYIKQIEFIQLRNEPYASLFVKTLSKPIRNLEKDPGKINRLLDNIRTQTNNFNFPQNACIRMQVIFHQLQELNDNIIQHKYLENDILLPRASAIEEQLLD